MKKSATICLSILCICGNLPAQTIEEKRRVASERGTRSEKEIEVVLEQVNKELADLRAQLSDSYRHAQELSEKGGNEKEFKQLLIQVNDVKKKIVDVEAHWHESSIDETKKESEGYALWDQEETTLAHLIMEYGANDYLYIIPPEMASFKLNMHSSIPIPRESWQDVLELVLLHNGVGVKKLNTYARQLYILKQDLAAVTQICSRPEHLHLAPNDARIMYVFAPLPEQTKGVFQFFERFSDSKQTFVYHVGGKIAIVSSRDEIDKLLSMYNMVWEEQKGKIARVVPVAKIPPKEMERVLMTFFGESQERSRSTFGKNDPDGLVVYSLSQGNAIVLIGQQSIVDRAEKIVRETEEQLLDPCENAIFIYACKHSDPADLAEMLEKVYISLLTVPSEDSHENVDVNFHAQSQRGRTFDGYETNAPLVVAPQPLNPGMSARLEIEQGIDHFIPDPKTGNLMMVVRRDTYPRIREILRRLDVPKKMVQIEVLLFERRLSNQNSFGMNLLKLGNEKNGVSFEGLFAPMGKGVFEFFFKGEKSKNFPAFDIMYSFLMTQDDVQLNAAPSVITVNQTTAQIAISEEISINNGAAPVDTNKDLTFIKSFSRQQYGITITFTPTVHMPDFCDDDEETKGFITLKTDISFQTIKPRSGSADQPDVDTRKVENEVRVTDGQTVILGGLRRKAARSEQDKIPFLGEIPGIGKLFGSTRMTSDNTEMFIFITPKIVVDSRDELERIRNEELRKRPGDIPPFLERLVEARKKERKKFFQESLKFFFTSDY